MAGGRDSVTSFNRCGVGDFRKLEAWRRAQELAVSVYRISEEFPAGERYSLTAQMRRSALSVSSNLAEGCGRHSDPELRRFVLISQGSLSELECQLLLAQELALIKLPSCDPLLEKIHKLRGMLDASRRALRRPPSRP